MAPTFRQLWELDTGRPVVLRLEVADSYWKRSWGLLGRKELPQGSGLWIAPCSGVHTFAMRFPIDLLFLDAQGRAIKVVSNLAPWRMCGPVRGARVVVELPAGAIEREGIQCERRYMLTSLESPDYRSNR